MTCNEQDRLFLGYYRNLLWSSYNWTEAQDGKLLNERSSCNDIEERFPWMGENISATTRKLVSNYIR